ncbi:MULTISPECIES: MOSC domain-containing protein [unclassified Pseudoxanthomonas]|uniref:MOSC domain-containing protein n=1 Tax=unclassified Pseudoxanthomonas TaxID=2645906 RepID=UPI0008F2B777|nr:MULTISPECIES: MOSC domain-containing protein [unclassified Pseudoxanthomonas]PPJ42670.1 MOSC domain-containing protein [Pseudoxanthomonas sp. KAs_5_3]SFV26583.1 MOSC domain-containing protein YiiM [Pseudoxanthomonas sp. YR558]
MNSKTTTTTCVIEDVLVGRAVPFTRAGSVSAIAKASVRGPQRVTTLGLAADEQGDLRVHGGPDKAIHHYPHDHYTPWREDVGPHPLLAKAGAFGENISTTGLTEADVCLGDRFRLGSALVEVSQSRQPCWKLSDRFEITDMARRVQDTGRTGWYYRVIEPGQVQQGDAIVLEARPHPAWPLSRFIDLLYQRAIEVDVLREVLALPLVPSWRTLFERRLERGAVENWQKRLIGVPPVE